MVVVVGLREMLVGNVAGDGEAVSGGGWIGVSGSEVGDGTVLALVRQERERGRRRLRRENRGVWAFKVKEGKPGSVGMRG